ncbi:GIY-YIG nuclease family protein [Patescibacteria group bacterium]|nr:MAG: GIY-YIG nuclease family protein [Patescibacteria group bacterium]
MYFVYLLQSEKDHQYYIGQTQDLSIRLEQHNAGTVRSTRHRTPFRLVGHETHPTRAEARWREYTLKRSAHQRKKFIEKLTHIPG